MFGLSQREILARMVKNTTKNQLQIYKKGIVEIYSQYTLKEFRDESNKPILLDKMQQVRLDYLQSVYDTIQKAEEAKFGKKVIDLDLVLLCIHLAGLPDEFDAAYFESNGISAGIIYLMLLFSRKIDPIEKDYQKSTELNEYQTYLMKNTLCCAAERWMI